MTSFKTPPEVWLEIMRMIDNPNTLAQLALTSSTFLPLARSILYRSIHLHRDSSMGTMLDTVNLLKRDINLAAVVERIRFRYDDEPCIVFDLLRGLPRIKAITLIESSFIGDAGLVPFVKIVQESCPLLKEFRYERPQHRKQGRQRPFHPGSLILSGLEKISWADASRSLKGFCFYKLN